jgi:predicted nucleotidyltransferase
MTPNDLSFIRQALDAVQVQGKDAKFLANLQVKIENELSEIQRLIQEEEQKKMIALSETISKSSPKK